MKKLLQLFCTACIFALTCNVHAEVIVQNAWVRATVPQQKAAGVFFDIQTTENLQLVEVQSSVAASAELHEMKLENDVMRMRPVEKLELPAGKKVNLKPGGYHLMLMGLKNQIKVGDVIPLRLILQDKNKKQQLVDIKVTAKPINTN
jgi:periplasmic copper chaperone A